MKMLLAVAVGGAVGAVARYKTIGWVTQAAGTGFPWGTAAVNVLGCLLMGILIELGAQRQLLTPALRALLAVGMLGGFTQIGRASCRERVCQYVLLSVVAV